MEGGKYYVYVLKLSNGGWYVGSTKNCYNRILSHFSTGGAIATKESKPLCVEKVYSLIDYMIGKEAAHLRAEVLIANDYAERYGYDKVRGAKHGMGWNDNPSANSLRFIRRCQNFAKTRAGSALMRSLKIIDHSEISEMVSKFQKTNAIE